MRQMFQVGCIGPYYIETESVMPDGTIRIERFLTETGERYSLLEFPPDYELDDNIEF